MRMKAADHVSNEMKAGSDFVRTIFKQQRIQ